MVPTPDFSTPGSEEEKDYNSESSYYSQSVHQSDRDFIAKDSESDYSVHSSSEFRGTQSYEYSGSSDFSLSPSPHSSKSDRRSSTSSGSDIQFISRNKIPVAFGPPPVIPQNEVGQSPSSRTSKKDREPGYEKSPSESDTDQFDD